MISKQWIQFFLIGLFGVLANSASAQQNAVVAQINNQSITLEEFNKKYNEVRALTVNPPTREQFLEDLIRYEIGLQEARKKKLTEDPAVRERLNQELYKALLEKELSDRVNKITVSDKEVEDYYTKNPEVRASHILIEIKPGASADQRKEARSRAEKVWSEVQKSRRPFEELVRLYSEDSITKPAGGDIGFQGRITLGPGIYDTLLKMKVGEVRGLIETQYGYHIVKLTGRRAFNDANKRQIRAAVFDEKRRQIFDAYFAALKKSYTVKTNRKALE